VRVRECARNGSIALGGTSRRTEGHTPRSATLTHGETDDTGGAISTHIKKDRFVMRRIAASARGVTRLRAGSACDGNTVMLNIVCTVSVDRIKQYRLNRSNGVQVQRMHIQ
jgi:hypothetical protein